MNEDKEDRSGYIRVESFSPLDPKPAEDSVQRTPVTLIDLIGRINNLEDYIQDTEHKSIHLKDSVIAESPIVNREDKKQNTYSNIIEALYEQVGYMEQSLKNANANIEEVYSLVGVYNKD